MSVSKKIDIKMITFPFKFPMKRRIIFHDLKMDIPVTTGYVARYYDELMYIIYDAPFCLLYFVDKQLRVEASLQSMINNLPKKIFFECSRPVIIHVDHCKEFNRTEAVVVMDDGRKFKISRRRIKDFIRKRYS